MLDWTKTINLSELTTGWYKFDLRELHANPSDFTLRLNNDLGRATYLGLELYKDCESARLVNLGDSVSEGLHVKSVSYDMLYMMIGAAPELYAYITIDGAPVPPTPAEGCETATDYVLGTTITVEANSDVWYKINLAELKASGKGLDIKIKNVDVVKANITASMAFECPGTIAQTLNYSIEAGDSLAATIPYSYYKDIESDVLYLNLKTTAKLEITVGESSVVVPDVPEGCENAKDLDFSKTINLSTIQTGWYRVDLTPLKNGSIKKVSINNDLGKVTGVQFDIFRNCEQSSFLYTYTHAFEVGLFEQSIPSSALSMLGSLNELYIYITMDVDVLTCEDAIEFDWSKGAVHSAGDTQWYHFDITSVENNAQQVKLTLTNHSNEMSVVYGEVAMHCPYTKSIPFACVVPAGMSIDKVVDYSVFKSSRVEELYVKVTSTKTIELGATTESALVFDQTPCNNATLVESGVEYRQSAGTSWYRLPKSLFMNTGKLPKFYFTTEEEGLTKITLGATVGCEYNIATKTIVMLPGSLNYAMVMPEQMFDLMDKLVSDDVTEVYVEMTTDRAVHFSVDMVNNTDDACHGAELLDV
ncbi:MAG: hypothetical protein IKW16_03090, partial [Clostridia bacterium]|nr:hypothetical protein [Clostridia bacterium]